MLWQPYKSMPVGCQSYCFTRYKQLLPKHHVFESRASNHMIMLRRVWIACLIACVRKHHSSNFHTSSTVVSRTPVHSHCPSVRPLDEVWMSSNQKTVFHAILLYIQLFSNWHILPFMIYVLIALKNPSLKVLCTNLTSSQYPDKIDKNFQLSVGDVCSVKHCRDGALLITKKTSVAV